MGIVYKIYILKDPITLEIRYVGVTCKSLNHRLSNHIYYAKRRNCTHVHNWILSLLLKDLKPLIESVEICNIDNWEEREIYWISYYSKLANLTNISKGGKGLIRNRTKSSRLMSALSHSIPILQFNLNNIFIKEFISATEASKETGISRTSICNNLSKISKSAGNFKWQYK